MLSQIRALLLCKPVVLASFWHSVSTNALIEYVFSYKRRRWSWESCLTLKAFPGYFVFSSVELLSLTLCLVLDISEYMVAVLAVPVIGDVLDVAGIVACLLMFRWIGVVSVFELVPGADIFPIFVITWVLWYFFARKRRRATQRTRIRTL